MKGAKLLFIVSLCLLLIPIQSEASPGASLDPSWQVQMLIIADVVSVIASATHIGRGRGSKSWGWFGITGGAMTGILGVADDNVRNGRVLVIGGVVAGTGLVSLLMSRRDKSYARVQIAPAVIQKADRQYEAGVMLRVSF